jgi:hypothetical protein
MDPLQQLVETLRVLARTNEPNRVALIEKAVNKYLNDKPGELCTRFQSALCAISSLAALKQLERLPD